MLVVGKRAIALPSGETRQPGEPIAEAKAWMNLRHFISTGRVEERPDPPAFDYQELLELADTKRIHEFASKHAIDTKGMERKDAIAAVLLSAGLNPR